MTASLESAVSDEGKQSPCLGATWSVCTEAVSPCHARRMWARLKHVVEQGNHEDLSVFASLETAWRSLLPDARAYTDKGGRSLQAMASKI